MVRIVEIVPAIPVTAVIVFDHGWVAKRLMPALRPLWVFIRTVFPVLGLLENLLGRDNVQRQRPFQVLQVYAFEIIIKKPGLFSGSYR